MNFGRIVGRVAAVAALVIAAAACSSALDGSSNGDSGESAEAQGDDLKIVTPGKADNYWSNVAKEFELTGTIDVEMTTEQFEDPTERNKVVSQRLTAVGLYLTTYLTDKIRGVDSDGSGEIEEDEVLFENMDYGGFKAMVRNYSVETEDVSEAGDGTYLVDYTIDVAGPQSFLQKLVEAGAEQAGSGVRFDFSMPAGATSDPDNVRRGEVRSFDPDEYSGELETVELVAEPHPQIQNAYPHYRAFLEDGVYDITLFYGHDYNEARHDLEGASEAFQTLTSMGFEAPALSFDQLAADSGPFVRTVETPGPGTPDEVRVEVRVFHSDMFEGARQQQHDRAIELLRKSDVFFYNGHAGPYYGFYLDANGQAEVDYRELAEIELSEKQQVFIAQGCQTYSQYADMLYANPAKSEANLDVITTVNYSYGRGTMELFKNFVTIEEGVHQPTPFYELVRTLNEDFWNGYKDVFYGAMGIDGNPQTHPYGNLEAIGQSCETAADCGANPTGNVCAEGACAVRALAEGSCPEGTQFGYLGNNTQMQTGICFGEFDGDSSNSDTDVQVQCSEDVNCSDLSTCEEARAYLEGCEGDYHGLDFDGDGTPCESMCN